MKPLSQSSKKIIVGIGMAVVIGVGAVAFTWNSHRPAVVAQAEAPPPALAAVPEAPAPVDQLPNAPAAAAQNERSGVTAVPDAVEPKIAGRQHLAKASTSTGTISRTATHTASALDLSNRSPDQTSANSVEGVKNVEVVKNAVEATTLPVANGMPADAQAAAMNVEPAASDSSITAEVKSRIAADSVSKDFDIGVTTTLGVVALTGALATQDAIDHVKDVAEKAKDVKSVDTSRMTITSS